MIKNILNYYNLKQKLHDMFPKCAKLQIFNRFFRGLFHQARKSVKMSYLLPLQLLSIGFSNNGGIDGFTFQLFVNERYKWRHINGTSL